MIILNDVQCGAMQCIMQNNYNYNDNNNYSYNHNDNNNYSHNYNDNNSNKLRTANSESYNYNNANNV